MKILFVAPRFHTNQYFVTKTLKEKGHNVHFFVLYKFPAVEKYDTIEPVVINKFLSFDYFKKLKTFNPDIVIIRDPNKSFSFINLIWAKLLKIKNIIIYTQGPLHRKKNLKTKINKVFLNVFGAKWTTPVVGDKEKYEKFDKRAYYLPFIIEPILKSFNEKHFFKNDKINIITIGKLNLERKNILLLLEAIKTLKNEFPLYLTIIGFLEKEESKYYLKIFDYIKKNNLSDIVKIKKNLDFFDVHKEYLKHDLFVLPSSNEPAAYSLVEAMSAGLPIISSDTNGTQCYIKEDENGYIFKSDDLEDLIQKIQLIIQDKKNIIKMGRKSHEFTLKNHSPEKFYQEFMKIIKN